ncbi:high mobility group B protein 3-like [Henckelia pumila]|uniref:high mobility group B protein 3-like n=1 Tax=Henckelia pumila TaxID=405737 RepID=UPI003C6E0F07
MKGGKSKTESKKADPKLSVKKGAASAGKKPVKKVQAAPKDPNKPKRPASAFFVFMEDFRKQFKEKHPNNKSVAAVGKAGGDKWKSMSDAEKAPFIAKAEKRKAEYEKTLQAYNKKIAEGTDAEDESDKSKSEVHDDEDDDDDDGSAEDDDEDDEDDED